MNPTIVTCLNEREGWDAWVRGAEEGGAGGGGAKCGWGEYKDKQKQQNKPNAD